MRNFERKTLHLYPRYLIYAIPALNPLKAQTSKPALMAICDAAAAKIGPPVRGAEPLWACVEALRASGGGDFEAGIATEGTLFARVGTHVIL